MKTLAGALMIGSSIACQEYTSIDTIPLVLFLVLGIFAFVVGVVSDEA